MRHNKTDREATMPRNEAHINVRRSDEARKRQRYMKLWRLALYILSIIAFANPEQLTSVAPSICLSRS
jgi:hypothetical protein